MPEAYISGRSFNGWLILLLPLALVPQTSSTSQRIPFSIENEPAALMPVPAMSGKIDIVCAFVPSYSLW